MASNTRTAIVMGATSGIGHEVAKLLLQRGWRVGLCGRRKHLLQPLLEAYPDKAFIRQIDILDEAASQQLLDLIDALGGIDLYFHSSGVGHQNMQMEMDIELHTVQTNVTGFVRMIDTAFSYFSHHPERPGHIACISSVAGTKGLGAAPSYSASKRFCSTYMEALEQQARMRHLPICFTDIRPGFVDTAILDSKHHYPLMLSPTPVARSIVRTLARRERKATIDWRYATLVFFWRLIPSWLWVRLKIRN